MATKLTNSHDNKTKVKEPKEKFNNILKTTSHN